MQLASWTICAAIGLASALPSGKSYYDVLGLDRDATTLDVRRQFRKLSVTLHPDKNPTANTPQGREDYRQLQLAHEWLSSDDRRQVYNLYGDWSAVDDRLRGRQYAGRHAAIEFFRDEPLIRNVRTESEAQQIFGLRTRRAYLMMLYAPWLTACVEATDVYRKVAHSMRDVTGEDGVRLAAVNCESNLQSFCLRYGRLRNQFELPVILLLDPTESLSERYAGRLVPEELAEFAIASDKGIRHVTTLDAGNFHQLVPGPGVASADLWLVLFCTTTEPLCRELKPLFKRLAYSARAAARLGLVNCGPERGRGGRGGAGEGELEALCREEGVDEVPALVAYRRGARSEARGEQIALLPDEHGHGEHGDPALQAPLIALRAVEAVLRLSAPPPRQDSEPESESGEEPQDEERLPRETDEL